MALEDFGTYTEVDPNSHITKTTRRITVAGLTSQEDAYVYLDKGAAFFDGDFTHDITVEATAVTADGRFYFWALTNAIDDMKGIDDASGSYLAAFIYGAGTNNIDIYIEESDSGGIFQDAWTAPAMDTPYYLKIIRDEAVGTYGTLYCYIYSDINRSTLVDTLLTTLRTSKKDFRYIFGANTRNSGIGGRTVSGYCENLELSGAILPKVTAQPATDITSVAATGHGTIVNLGISAVSAHGYCWATTVDPTTADSKTDEGGGSLGVFESSITGLSTGQEYYARPYATNGAGTSYGANVYFIAGQPGTLRIKGEYAVVQTQWHYVDEDGKERQITGTLV